MGSLETFFQNNQRLVSLKLLAPDLFSGNFKTILNIGAHEGRFDFGDLFEQVGFDITILEIFKPNVEYLQSLKKWRIIHGDILEYDFKEKFDVVFWWHGPEHIEKDKLSYAVKRIELISNNLVIMGCPWGVYVQGPCYGNEFEIHKSHYDVDDFIKIGYNCFTIGTKNIEGSNITSVKYIYE